MKTPLKATSSPDTSGRGETNCFVWDLMQNISMNSGLEFKPKTQQASLWSEEKKLGTGRVFRHKCANGKHDILLRKDIFEFAPDLARVEGWREHKEGKAFRTLRTDDLGLLNRVLDTVTRFAKARQR